MSDRSNIEWTDASWNPIRARTKTGKVGWHCEHKSTGCEHCYAEGMNKRLGTGLPFKPGHLQNGDIELFLDEATLIQPLRWKKPRMIFPCSMTDLFADFVPDEWLDKIFAVMALTPQHTYQPLTKRAERMREYFCPGSEALHTRWLLAARDILGCHAAGVINSIWPLPNVWLGVSAERQQEADERIPLLLQTPAAVRFVSLEPLLGPIDLGEHVRAYQCHDCFNGLTRVNEYFFDERCPVCGGSGVAKPRLDWVIVGGESGPAARPMHPDWARSLRDQRAAANVAFFFKQWGEWLPGEANRGQFDPHPMHAYRRCDSHSYDWPSHTRTENFGTHPDPHSGDVTAKRVGKKAAGRLLDGVEHNDMPKRRL